MKLSMGLLKGIFLISAAPFFMVAQAQADIDVSCVLGDCLTEGWQSLDERGESLMTVCQNFDCNTTGWTNEYRQRVTTEVHCKREGCFNDGWTVYDTASGRLVADVSCQTSFATSDCLQFGWTTSEPGRGSYVTRCVDGDCRNIGCDVQAAGFAPQPVRCKRGGCFTTGWIVYR